jgi:hypothetical protein
VTAALEAAGYDPRGNLRVSDHGGHRSSPARLDPHATPGENPNPQEMDHPPEA